MGPVATTSASFLSMSPNIQGYLTRGPICTWRWQDLPSHDLKDMVGCEGLGWNLPFGGFLQQRQDTFSRPGEKPFRHSSSPHHGTSSKFTSMSSTTSPSSPKAQAHHSSPNCACGTAPLSHLCHLRRTKSKSKVRWVANSARWKARCRNRVSGRKRQFTVQRKRNWRPRSKERDR